MAMRAPGEESVAAAASASPSRLLAVDEPGDMAVPGSVRGAGDFCPPAAVGMLCPRVGGEAPDPFSLRPATSAALGAALPH